MKEKSCNCGPNCACKNCVCGPRAAFFETLGNEGRLYILHTLRNGPRSVSDLVTATGMTQTHVSHNLKHLESFGFVTASRDGKYRVYELAMELEPLLKLIDKHVDAHYTGAAKACCCSKDRNKTAVHGHEAHA
jgi:DNA-binding transcriptional ArsR family regulator